jgi:hypothetical protein
MWKKNEKKQVTTKTRNWLIAVTALTISSPALAAPNPCNIYIGELAPRNIMDSYHVISDELRNQYEKLRDDLQSKGYHVVYNRDDADTSVESFYSGCAEKAQTTPAVCELAYTKIEFTSRSHSGFATYADESYGTNLRLVYLPPSVDTTYTNTLKQIPNCQPSGN